MEYSQKELMIFQGVSKLASQGKSIYTVTAQQIASAAGVGKGTIYEYFSTKEEIIAKAIIYSIEQENIQLKKAVATATNFEGKIGAVFDRVLDSFSNSLSAFNVMMSAGGTKELMAFLCAGSKSYGDVVGQSTKIFTDILACGVDEGKFPLPTEPEYVKMVLSASILAVGKTAIEDMKKENLEETKEKIKENAYIMLIKALN